MKVNNLFSDFDILSIALNSDAFFPSVFFVSLQTKACLNAAIDHHLLVMVRYSMGL